ncbi:hypothetical protein ACMDCR_29225 [Labrys okinawensis]|uniref:hypothetical protein n=1 Tax=Labrys okinawensis TaxID=346911 RepID=UPI0039BC2583
MAVVALMLAVETAFAAGKTVGLKLEHSPSGDVPDNQVFLSHIFPDACETAAGRAWRTRSQGVQFAGKYDTLAIGIEDAAAATACGAAKGRIVPSFRRRAERLR